MCVGVIMDISQDAVERLSRYRMVLLRLKSLGFVKVFSDNLGDALGISASQVRKDFAAFGMKGAKRGGYQIADLIDRLTQLLGVTGVLKAVVVGCGNIGTALMKMYGGKRDGVCVVAGFDVDSSLINPHADVPIYDVHELSAFIEKHSIRVAILAVPEEAAPGVLELLRQSAVRGVLNFTPAQLRSDKQCLVHHMNIRMEIEKLFCMVHLLGR